MACVAWASGHVGGIGDREVGGRLAHRGQAPAGRSTISTAGARERGDRRRQAAGQHRRVSAPSRGLRGRPSSSPGARGTARPRRVLIGRAHARVERHAHQALRRRAGRRSAPRRSQPRRSARDAQLGRAASSIRAAALLARASVMSKIAPSTWRPCESRTSWPRSSTQRTAPSARTIRIDRERHCSAVTVTTACSTRSRSQGGRCRRRAAALAMVGRRQPEIRSTSDQLERAPTCQAERKRPGTFSISAPRVVGPLLGGAGRPRASEQSAR